MVINVFAKQATSRDGRQFTNYLGRLTNNKTGEVKTVKLKFRQSAGAPDPDACPCTIRFNKTDANLSEKPIVNPETGDFLLDADGNVKISSLMWISAWEMVGPYEDHSLDDYE